MAEITHIAWVCVQNQASIPGQLANIGALNRRLEEMPSSMGQVAPLQIIEVHFLADQSTPCNCTFRVLCLVNEHAYEQLKRVKHTGLFLAPFPCPHLAPAIAVHAVPSCSGALAKKVRSVPSNLALLRTRSKWPLRDASRASAFGEQGKRLKSGRTQLVGSMLHSGFEYLAQHGPSIHVFDDWKRAWAATADIFDGHGRACARIKTAVHRRMEDLERAQPQSFPPLPHAGRRKKDAPLSDPPTLVESDEEHPPTPTPTPQTKTQSKHKIDLKRLGEVQWQNPFAPQAPIAPRGFEFKNVGAPTLFCAPPPNAKLADLEWLQQTAPALLAAFSSAHVR